MYVSNLVFCVVGHEFLDYLVNIDTDTIEVVSMVIDKAGLILSPSCNTVLAWVPLPLV